MMIDKIAFRKPLPDSIDSDYPEEVLFNINGLTANARRNGVYIYEYKTQNNLIIYKVRGYPGVIFITNWRGTVIKVFTNPSHFRSFGEYTNFLNCIDSSSPFSNDITMNEPPEGGWLEHFEVCRVDYAVRIYEPYNEIGPFIDVRNKQNNKSYEQGRGINGVIYGKNDSVIKVYDEALHNQINRDSDTYPNFYPTAEDTGLTKIEHQVSSPRKIKEIAGYSYNLKFRDLYAHFTDIANGNCTPLRQTIRLNIRIKNRNELNTNIQREKAEGLRTSLRIAPFSVIRRSLNKSQNFNTIYGPVLEKARLAPSEQPSNLLRYSLYNYLQFEQYEREAN